MGEIGFRAVGLLYRALIQIRGTEGAAMPRMPRRRGESGFYHVVTKGDGGQIVFEDERDRRRYIELLRLSLAENDAVLHAYCLMSNHVHLLVEDKDEDFGLGAFMKQLNEGYAMYFQRRSQRVGHVFQGRYWSEPVESDAYFLCALRYIHANPEHAGICRARDYPWSSYRAHLGSGSFVEVDFSRRLLGGADEFERFSSSGRCCAKPYPASKLNGHLSADELERVALNLLGRDTLANLRCMSVRTRQPHLAALVRSGFNEGEIARVTGLGRTAIRRAKQDL